MFSYKPISREESDQPKEYPLLEDGVYWFKTESVKFKYSHAGNPMIELKNVHIDAEGNKYVIFDYLLDSEKMNWKTRHYCDAVGLSTYYEEGKFNEHMCAEREGFMKVKTQPKREYNGVIYSAKNAIEDYCVTATGSTKSELQGEKIKEAKVEAKHIEEFDKDIPF